MTTEVKSKLETYAKSEMAKTGKFTPEEIDKVVNTILQLFTTEEQVDAFIKASQ